MKLKDIIWAENGWTLIQDADAAKHTLEISCLSENGVVVELRKRHNDGEEEKVKKSIDANHTLPMPLKDFRIAFEEGEIKFK